MAKKYKKSEAVEMLSAMERKAGDVQTIAQAVEDGATKNSFALYDRFVRTASDFDTLSILVETRLQNVEIGAGNVQGLQDQYDMLKIVVAHRQIQASMKFFYILSAATTLPLGAKDLFSSELRRLYSLKSELDRPKYQGMLSEDALNDLNTAELILQEIIEKAPSLLNFSRA
ncbi:hypothetical protein [Sneathiella chinensis]|uniref:Uncharacterized protein n=1 Tax=Sneathiella chinensis TaxID=349750 RepID=A0ABQ5U344_9PROT|nr:hypothetical protein [Sneathiella chinensis]GLQ06585.1 hypothetical protein GCM10007924_18060 [Sneathiella chinensis]